jgi:hypothetical protein
MTEIIKENFWLKNFTNNLLNNSNSKKYYEAVKEWELIDVYFEEEYGDSKCICTHPIQEVCVIKNKFNNRVLHTGNCCVNKITGDKKIEFMGKNYNMYDYLKDAHEAVKNREINKALIIVAQGMGFLYPNQYDFLIQIHRRKQETLTDAQLRFASKILYKITKRLEAMKEIKEN